MNGSQLATKLNSSVEATDKAKTAIERDMHKLQQNLGSIDTRKVALMREMAKLQVNAFMDGNNAQSFRFSTRLIDIIEDREQAFKDLEILMDKTRHALKNRELELATNVQIKTAKVEAANAEVETRQDILQGKTEAQALQEKITQVSHLKIKAGSESADKLIAFEVDPVFQRLLKRGYGTTDYKGFGLGRWVDNWFARIIDFKQSKHDYQVLRALPEAATKRIDDLMRTYKQKLDWVDQEMDTILEKHGVIEARQRVNNAKARLSECRNDLAKMQEALNAFLDRADPPMLRIQQEMLEQLRPLSIPTLERLSQTTKSDKDNSLLLEYKHLVEMENALGLQHETLSIQLKEASARFKKAKELRDHLSNNGLTSSRRKYIGNFDTDTAMTGYIAGTLALDSILTDARNSSIERNDASRSVNNNHTQWVTDEVIGSSSSSWSTGDSMSSSGSWSTSDSF